MTSKSRNCNQVITNICKRKKQPGTIKRETQWYKRSKYAKQSVCKKVQRGMLNNQNESKQEETGLKKRKEDIYKTIT